MILNSFAIAYPKTTVDVALKIFDRMGNLLNKTTHQYVNYQYYIASIEICYLPCSVGYNVSYNL